MRFVVITAHGTTKRECRWSAHRVCLHPGRHVRAADTALQVHSATGDCASGRQRSASRLVSTVRVVTVHLDTIGRRSVWLCASVHVRICMIDKLKVHMYQ